MSLLAAWLEAVGWGTAKKLTDAAAARGRARIARQNERLSRSGHYAIETLEHRVLLSQLQTQLILPANVGRDTAATFYVEYSNTGTVSMPAPVLLLESSNAADKPLVTLDSSLFGSGLNTSTVPNGYANTVEILASGKTPGTLAPGESGIVPVYYAGMEQPWNLTETSFRFDLQIFTATDTAAVSWSSLQSALQPPSVPTTAWNIIYANLTASLGSTWGGYVQALDNQASYLSQLGENVTNVGQLWGFALQQADNALSPVGPYLASATDDALSTPGSLSLSFSRVFAESISGRDTMSTLGMGWSTPWQTSASTASNGTVTITGAGGAQRIFQPEAQTGDYLSQPGDTGALTSDGSSGYLLTENDGVATDYNASGTLNYIQDTDGNRIAAGYTGSELTSLTASTGQSFAISYNAAGLISAVMDSDSRTTTYAYDASNQRLISVTGYNGQATSYSYNTTSGSASQNALTSITFPGGRQQNFTYDSQGRLTGTSSDGSAQPLSFAYSLGQVSVMDGAGDTSNLYYNEQGLEIKSVDPLGNATLFTYDADFNLIAVTNVAGQSETYSYNAAGEVVSSTDFLGKTTSFSYSGPFNALASMKDANGNATSYSYNSAGGLLTTKYADGTSQSSTFNPLGEATSFLNANSQPINYTYNSTGQLLTESFSDGSSYAYTYDGNGNLLTATDVTGTTTFTYDPTTELLTKVAYPNSTSLTFTYNTAGQRTTMVDQTGFTVNYTYDAVGRLSELTDSGGNPIVTYTYDAAGRLSKETNGNGTYTTYIYDADGNVLSLVNYAPGGAINSSFSYTYNSLGLETSETTVNGAWTYTYDADGQLTGAVFASTNPSVAGQTLVYNYDAMGNRISTVVNGVTTAYVTNDMNGYTSVGGVAYTYDANGNLTSDGTNTYAYNSLNQLLSVTGPSGTTTNTYNALGEQVTSTINGQPTQNLTDPAGLGTVVGRFNGSGGLIADYTYGLGLVSQVTPGGNNYYQFDAVGSTADLTNSSGAIADTYSYLPFGENLNSTGSASNPFRFVGQFGGSTDGSGTIQMRARSYASQIGHFLTNDPLGLFGGSTNFRDYVGNDPTNEVDPFGTSAIPLPAVVALQVFLSSLWTAPVASIPGAVAAYRPELPASVTELVTSGQEAIGELAKLLVENAKTEGAVASAISEGAVVETSAGAGEVAAATVLGAEEGSLLGPLGALGGAAAFGLIAYFLNHSPTSSSPGDGLGSPELSARIPALSGGTAGAAVEAPVIPATISLNTTALDFTATQGGSAPASQNVTITNTGQADSLLNYAIVSSASWATVGTGPGQPLASGASWQESVSVNPAGLAVGTYVATLTVTAPATSNSGQTITVTLIIQAAPNYTFNVGTENVECSASSQAQSYDMYDGYIYNNGPTLDNVGHLSSSAESQAAIQGYAGGTDTASASASGSVTITNNQLQIQGSASSATSSTDGGFYNDAEATAFIGGGGQMLAFSLGFTLATAASITVTGTCTATGDYEAWFSVDDPNEGIFLGGTSGGTNVPIDTTSPLLLVAGTYGIDAQLYSSVAGSNPIGASSLNVTLAIGSPTSHLTMQSLAAVSSAIVASAPAVAVDTPPVATVGENGSLLFAGALTLADSQADGNPESLVLTATNGTFALASTLGLTVVAGANGSNALTVTGSLDSLNAAIDDLVYTPTVNTSGSGSLGIAIKDPVNGLSASASVAITINSGASSATPSFLSPILGNVILPPQVVAGAKFKAKVPVVISNAGSAFKGDVTIRIYADTGTSLDGNQVLVTSLTKRVSLKAHQRQTFNFNIKSLPSALADGTYHLLAEVIDPSGATNVTATTQTVQVAAAFIQPAVSIGSVIPARIAIGKSGAILVTVTNNGNVAASGVGITLSPSEDGVTAVAGVILARIRSNAKIQPKKSKTFRLHFKAISALAAGSYFPYISVLVGGVPMTKVGTMQFTVV